MLSNMLGSNGVIVQSTSDAWLATTQEKIGEILSQFE
jgi:hypothetical protein